MYYPNSPFKYVFRVSGRVDDGKWPVTRFHSAQKLQYLAGFNWQYEDWNNVVVF